MRLEPGEGRRIRAQPTTDQPQHALLSRSERLWCRIRMWAALPLTSVSGDALGYWHAKAGHDVDDLAARRGFGLLRRQSPSVEAATNQGFVAHHRHLAQ
jgi:hypothetical protein